MIFCRSSPAGRVQIPPSKSLKTRWRMASVGPALAEQFVQPVLDEIDVLRA